MQLQDYEVIIESLNKQLEQDPENTELMLKLVEAYLRVEGDEYFNSVIILDRILELEPYNFPANKIRALIYRDQDNLDKALECFKTILDSYVQIKDRPEYQDIVFDYAETLELADRETEALPIFEEMLQQYPQNIAVLFKLAHLYSALDRHEEAIARYKCIIELDPENEAALNYLSELYETVDKSLYHSTRAELASKDGNFSRALNEYKKMLPYAETPQEECEIHKKIAGAYTVTGDYNHALDSYNMALDLVEDDYEIYKGLGKLCIEQEELEVAVEYFEKAVNLNPEDYSLYVDLAECFMDLKKYPEAIRELEIVKKHKPADLLIRNAIAEAYIKTRDLYHAKEELDYILARESENTVALGLMVDLNVEKEDYKAAQEYAKKLVDLLPNNAYSARKLAECYESLGEKYEAHFNYGLSYELQGEHGMAIDEYEQAVQQKPDDANLIMKIGDLYSALGEKYVGMEYYEKATEADPQSVLPLEKLGEFYLSNNNSDKALDVYSRLIEVNPRHSDAYFNVGTLSERAGYLEEALEAYQKFLEVAPNSTRADKISRKVDKLRKKLGLQSESEEDYYDADMSLFDKIKNYFRK